MAQTLTALVALHHPVVPADQTIPINNIAALEDLAPKQLLGVFILGSIHSMYLTVDYRTNHTQLIQDAMVISKGVSLIDMTDVSKVIWQLLAMSSWDSGYSADPRTIANPTGLSNDVNAILAEARDLIELPMEILLRVMFLLSLS